MKQMEALEALNLEEECIATTSLPPPHTFLIFLQKIPKNVICSISTTQKIQVFMTITHKQPTIRHVFLGFASFQHIILHLFFSINNICI